MASKNYKEILKNINTFIFDVDGVLTDSSLLVTSSGELLRIMNTRDGLALKKAIENNYNVAIISGGKNEGVKTRLEKLGIDDVYLGYHTKNKAFKDYLSKSNIDPSNVLYMGDDLPDIPVMKQVALPCCPQDAVAEVKSVSKYISHINGGRGAVRDVIEQVLKVRGQWN